jgi:hypothetical protein
MQPRAIAAVGGNDLGGGNNFVHPQQLARKIWYEEARYHRFVLLNETSLVSSRER